MIAALIYHLLASTIFAAAILLAAVCLRHRSATTRHTLLLCAALKFALPLQWLIALGASLRSFLPAPNLRFFPVAHVSSTALPAGMHTPPTGNLLTPIVLTVWLAIASLLLFLWLRRLFATVPATADSASHAAVTTLERMRVRLGMTHPVHLRVTQETMAPRLYGLWRATVVLPQTLSERLTAEELEAVLLHELAHARRRDNLTRALVHALTCVFWFYPLLWRLERRIDMEGELACDELVLAYGASRHAYLDGLLKVCQFYLLESVAGSSNVSGSNLKHRLEMIMSSQIENTRFCSTSYLAGLTLTSVAAAAVFAGFLAAMPSQGQPAAGRAAKPAPVRCIAASVSYPEGTVLKLGHGPQQLCVSNPLDGTPFWVRTSEEMRQGGQQIVALPEPTPVYCKQPTASIGNYCTCETTVRFSRNATVSSDKGVLTCGAGGKWQTYGKR